MQTLRALRAIIGLRWRVLKNTIAGGRKRDALEQMSRALALVVPVLIASLSIGTFVAISMVAFIGGRGVGTGAMDETLGIFLLRAILAVMTFAIIVLSLVSPAQSSITRYTRLMLMPIHRRVLHLVEVLATIADPWLAVVGAGLVSFGIGLAFGGRPGAALAALIAAGATVAFLVCAGSLAGFLVTWLMRSRRRGELFTLVFVMAISMVSMMPMFASKSLEKPRDQEGRRIQRAFNVREFNRTLPAWTHYLPPELHGGALAAGLAGDGAGFAKNVAVLVLEAGVFFFISSRVHARMLNSLEGDASRRRTSDIAGPSPRIPLLTPGASAVAWAQFKGAMRTVRGRLTILLPGPMLGMMTLAFKRLPQETWATSASQQGYLLLGACIVFTLYSMHAISMNFFGSDRAGFTRQLLAPLTDRDIAWGKVAAFAMIAGSGVVTCLAISLAVARSGPPAYWIATLIGGAATFILLCPLAIWFSALFPVASDLGKTGSGGNPHPLPMIAGTFCTALFAGPAAVIIVVAEYIVRSQTWAVMIMLLWLAVAAGVAIPLVNLAARSIGSRRENLALVAQGK